ncbi:unnamed protein product, partial [Symbiodinium microadriaticum]
NRIRTTETRADITFEFQKADGRVHKVRDSAVFGDVTQKLALAKQIEEDLENTKYSEGSEGWFFLRGGTPARIDWDEKVTYNPKKDNVKEFKYSATLITRYEGDRVMWNELEFYQCAEEWQGQKDIEMEEIEEKEKVQEMGKRKGCEREKSDQVFNKLKGYVEEAWYDIRRLKIKVEGDVEITMNSKHIEGPTGSDMESLRKRAEELDASAEVHLSASEGEKNEKKDEEQKLRKVLKKAEEEMEGKSESSESSSSSESSEENAEEAKQKANASGEKKQEEKKEEDDDPQSEQMAEKKN